MRAGNENSSRGHLRKAIDDYCKGCAYDPLPAELATTGHSMPIEECQLYPIRPVSQDAKHLLDAASGHHQTVKEVLKAASKQMQGSSCE